jgi:hypothetical protein
MHFNIYYYFLIYVIRENIVTVKKNYLEVSTGVHILSISKKQTVVMSSVCTYVRGHWCLNVRKDFIHIRYLFNYPS